MSPGNGRFWDRKVQILIVDRDPLGAGGLVGALPPNAETVVASSVSDALRIGDRGEFDLVVVDIASSAATELARLDDVRVGFPGTPVLALIGAEDALLSDVVLARGARESRSRSALTAPEFAATVARLLGGRDRGEEIAGRAAHVENVLSAIGEGIVVQSPSGRVVLATDRALEMLQVPREELVSSDLAGVGIEVRSAAGRILATDELPDAVARRSRGQVPPVLLQVRRRDGELRWFEARTSPLIRSGEDEAYAVVTSFRDVTEAHFANEMVVDTERRERLLLEQAGEGYLVLDKHRSVLESSEFVERFWPRELVDGRNVCDLFVDDDRGDLASLLDDVVARRASPLRAEARTVDRKGNIRWIELTLTNRLEEPSLIGIVANLRDVTDRKHAEDTVMRLSAIVDSRDEAIYSETLDGVITSWNAAAARLFGYSAREAVATSSLVITPAQRLDSVLETRERILKKRKVAVGRTVRRRKDGSDVEVSLLVVPLFDSSGNLIGSATTATRAARTKDFDLGSVPNEDRLRLGFDRGAVGMAMVDISGTITHVNPSFCSMLARTEAELLGHRPADFLHRGDMEALRVDAAGSEDPARYGGERHFLRTDGTIVDTLVEVSAIRDQDGTTSYLCQVQDVTGWRKREAELEHRALHDPLTGLANRTMLSARLDLAAARNRRERSKSALIAIDLDRFQLINDGLGHASGDQLLADVAGRLVSACAPGDLVARFGSDEFIVLRDEITGVHEADELADKVKSVFVEPFDIDERPAYVSVSCGVTVIDGSQSVDDALRSVEAAMHWSKEHGGDQTTHFDRGIAENVTERFDLEREIHFALERDEMRVFYQPILTVGSAELVGVEALVRWQHPRRGLLAPGEFIPVAERSGLISAIGSFVLETALRQVMAWRRELRGCEDLWVSVNFSSRQLLLSNPVSACLWALASTGAPADALRLELTETAVMEEIETAIRRLADLRSIGIKVAIDDFGTGHSSLSHLDRLPVGTLKFDQSFIDAIDSGSQATIVDTIVNLAHALKLELCAEGIERQDQRVALHRLGCEFGQGFLWSKPLAADDFAAWIEATFSTRPA